MRENRESLVKFNMLILQYPIRYRKVVSCYYIFQTIFITYKLESLK